MLYLTIIHRRRGEYLVNKPLQAAGMSADNVRGWEIVRKMNIWPRSEASRANVKFWGQSLSQGHYQPTYQPPVDKSSYHARCSQINWTWTWMCHAMPFWTRALKKKHFLWHSYSVKTNQNVVYRGLYSYRQWVRFITLFPNNFLVLLLHVERVCKSFWKKSLTRTSSSFA